MNEYRLLLSKKKNLFVYIGKYIIRLFSI